MKHQSIITPSTMVRCS